MTYILFALFLFFNKKEIPAREQNSSVCYKIFIEFERNTGTPGLEAD